MTQNKHVFSKSIASSTLYSFEIKAYCQWEVGNRTRQQNFTFTIKAWNIILCSFIIAQYFKAFLVNCIVLFLQSKKNWSKIKNFDLRQGKFLKAHNKVLKTHNRKNIGTVLPPRNNHTFSKSIASSTHTSFKTKSMGSRR